MTMLPTLHENRTLLQATYMLKTMVKLHAETNSIKANAESELEVLMNVLNYAGHDQRHVIA